MKKILLLCCLIVPAIAGITQTAPVKFSRPGEKPVLRPTYRIGDVIPGQSSPNVIVSTKSVLDDPVLGMTKYDLQTNASDQNRIYLYPDGTVGATFIMAHLDDFSDRGTGYNYFDGTAWGAQPSAKIEGIKTGWPSYAPFGPTGEIVTSHRFATFPMHILTRPVKGTGAWTETTLDMPSGAAGIDWPRMVTSGPDHTNIHIIALTPPTASGGNVYQGLDGAIVYNRSLDGGTSWDGWQILDGMTSSDYPGFSADSYAWADPRGDTLCFVVGESWYDQFIMKSTDNGESWTKTTIWPCPYNFWAGGNTVGTFYCPDGASAVTLDMYGKAHVLFGLQRDSGDASGGKYWFPYTDGLIYWNEDKPQLPEVLDPVWLDENGYVIGWVQDTMVWYSDPTQLAHYYLSMSSMPQITTDNNGSVFALWSGVTTLTDPDNLMLRHLFTRTAIDEGAVWLDDFTDITGDFLYTWTECVYPSLSPTTDDYLHVVFQADDYAGSYVQGLNVTGFQGQGSITDNSMTYLKKWKGEVGIKENQGQAGKIVVLSGNYPNPAKDRTTIKVTVTKPVSLRIELTTLLGQTIRVADLGKVSAGNHPVEMDLSGLLPGIYQYTVIADGERATGKVVVE
jgi:hypothetical protein